MRNNWDQAFLAALADTGVLSAAAELASVERTTVWRRRQNDPEFAKACEEALKLAADALEQEARRRALEGAQEPVIYQGQPTYVYETDEAGYPVMDTVQEEQPGFDDKGSAIVRLVDVRRPRRKLDANGQPVILTVSKRSDALLALLLKGRRKEVFADRTELTGADAGPVAFADGSKRQARLAALVKLAEARKALEDEDFV